MHFQSLNQMAEPTQEKVEHLKVAPDADGLYDPRLEREACGVGFVVSIDGVRSNKVNQPTSYSLIDFNHRYRFQE